MSNSEQSEFKKFLESKLFKIRNRKRVIALYNYLISKCAPDYPDHLISNDVLEKKLSDKNVKNVKSSLTKALSDYFVWSYLDKNDYEKKHVELLAYSTRKMLEEFDRTQDSLYNYRSSAPDHTLNDYLLLKVRIQERTLRLDSIKWGKSFAEMVEKYLTTLDEYFIAMKIVAAIQNLKMKKREGIEFENHFVNAVIEGARSGRYDKNSIIPIYLKFYEFENDSEGVDQISNFQFLKAEVFRLRKKVWFDNGVLLEMLKSMALEIYKRDSTKENLIELFESYKAGISEQNYNSEFYLDPIIFKNIVSLAAAVNEVSWIKEFIQNNTNHLAKEFQNDALCLANAEIHFLEKDYDKSIEAMIFMDHDHFFFTSRSKLLLAINYFHKEEYVLLVDYLKSYETYIRRNNRLESGMKHPSLKFSKYLKKLINFKQLGNRFSKNEVDLLVKDYGVSSKHWLIEQYQLLSE